MVSMHTEKLKKEFLLKAMEHHSAILEGDHKNANKLHKKLMKLYKSLKKDEQLDLLVPFLHNENEGIMLWASTFLLNTNNSELAANTLNKLISHPTIVSMNAKMILELWKKGELELL
jgi:lipopolysaccharide biosynthesis regulator YciM